jgi:DNA-binding cell septation regulator SpoVG
MPSQKLNKPYKNNKGEDVQFQDHFYPITAEFREQLNKAIISGYDDEFPF